jgi:hypothetical protein
MPTLSPKPILEYGRSKAQLKTRVSPRVKRDITLVAFDQERPLCEVVEEALVAHVVRARLQAAAEYAEYVQPE